MSVSDLQKLGLLRKESDWDAKHMRSVVPRPLWISLVFLSISGCVMLSLGDGGVITWIGLLIFSVSMLSFVWMNIASVNRALLQEDGDDSENGSSQAPGGQAPVSPGSP